MCVILICEKVKPTFDIVSRCWDENSHGAGICWFNNESEKVQYLKGLTSKEAVFDIINKTPMPFVLHFRNKSGGSAGNEVNPLLTHPFEVSKKSALKLSGEASKLLFHNGTVSNWELLFNAAGFEKDEELWSDTRAIAKIISRKNEWFLDKIEKEKAMVNRFVLVDGETKTITKIGGFSKEEDITYSNFSWKSRTYTNYNDYCGFSSKGKQKKNIKVILPVGSDGKKRQESDEVKINERMSKSQYESGVMYSNDKDNKDFYAKEGMKERRRWWRFFYRDDLYEKTRSPDKNLIKCCICNTLLLNHEININRIFGKPTEEWVCATKACYDAYLIREHVILNLMQRSNKKTYLLV